MTALKMTVDDALALADDWVQGTTLHADSRGMNAIMLVLATEVRRLRAALDAERSRECEITADDPGNPDGTYFVTACGAALDTGDDGPPPLGELLGYRCHRCGGHLRCAADAYEPESLE